MKYEDSRQAWIVAVAGSLLLFIVLGSNRTGGVLFVALMEQEDLSRGTASWPLNLPGASVIFVSPIVGFLAVRYSPACLTFVGSVIYVLSHIPCYFSTNIYVLSVFFGIVKGCGLAIVAGVVPVITATSFRKNRGTAMGISTAGQPLAGMLLPILVQFLLLEYGLKGTFLLMAGLSMHLFIGCVGYRFYPSKTMKGNTDSRPKKIKSGDPDERTPLLASAPNQKPNLYTEKEGKRRNERGSNLERENENRNEVRKKESYKHDESSPLFGSMDDEEYSNATKKGQGEKGNRVEQWNGNADDSKNEKTDDSKNENPDDSKNENADDLRNENPDDSKNEIKKGNGSKNEHEEENGSKKGNFKEVDLGNRDDLDNRNDSESQNENRKELENKNKTKQTNVETGGKHSATSSLKSMLSNRVFYIVTVNQILNVFMSQTLSQVVIDYLSDKGIPESKGLYMMTSASCGELAGRICLGWIPDKKILRNENHTALFLLLSSAMVFLMINTDNYIILMVAVFIFGAGQGTVLSMNFVHFADRMTRPELSLAVSFTRSINGVSAVLRAPVIGAFRDQLGSYDHLFYFLAGMVALLAVPWMIEGNVCAKKNKKTPTA